MSLRSNPTCLLTAAVDKLMGVFIMAPSPECIHLFLSASLSLNTYGDKYINMLLPDAESWRLDLHFPLRCPPLLPAASVSCGAWLLESVSLSVSRSLLPAVLCGYQRPSCEAFCLIVLSDTLYMNGMTCDLFEQSLQTESGIITDGD